MSNATIIELCHQLAEARANLAEAKARPWAPPRIHEMNDHNIWHIFSGPPHAQAAEKALTAAHKAFKAERERLRVLKWEREAPERKAWAEHVAAMKAAYEARIRCHTCRDTDAICAMCGDVPADKCGYPIGHFERLKPCPNCSTAEVSR